MQPFIRTSFILLFSSLITVTCFAGPAAAKPVDQFTLQADQISKLGEILSSTPVMVVENTTSGEAAARDKSVSHICSCQILDMSSSNYDHQHVVLLAEKTNNGDSKDYSIARNRIQREKKQLKKMFYDTVKLVSETQSAGSCKSLYYRLKTADNELKLYEILNADIQ